MRQTITPITPHFEIQSGHTETVTSVAFSHDGQLLASGGFDGLVKVWEVASGTLKFTLEGSGEGFEVKYLNTGTCRYLEGVMIRHCFWNCYNPKNTLKHTPS